MFRKIYQSPFKTTDKTNNSTELKKNHAYTYNIDADENFDVAVRNDVKRLWETVEKQCQSSIGSLKIEDGQHQSDLDWNIVRVFVSSTFTDFFNEREVLVKKVFPELREWCQGRGLKLVECDLRWGIPKDTSTSETILVCLDELERCKKTNKNNPFFINLVGERYGWIPTLKETPEEAKDKYQWVEGASITFMEVLYGAYRNANPNAAFFMRNSSVCEEIPKAHISRFIDAEPIAKCHLKMLRNKLWDRFPNQVFPYTCQFKQVNNTSGREQVELSGLDTFANSALNFLKSSIEKMYPASLKENTPVDANLQEDKLEWMYVLDKAKEFIGRQNELKNLKDFIEHGLNTSLEKTTLDKNHNPENNVRNMNDWDLKETDHSILVVEGPSGYGKTTLLCRLLVDAVKTHHNVFYHFVGSTPSSTLAANLLQRLCRTLLSKPTDDEKGLLESESLEQLQKLLRIALNKFRQRQDQKLILILDGVNELDTFDTYKHLSWLPPSFPNNMHCIVGSDLHPPTTARLYEYPVYKMTLQPMAPKDLTDIAIKYLAQFNKRLDPAQLSKVVSKTKVDNPLWVMLMVEELRVFGDFRLMDSKIDNFPDNLSDFLAQTFDRLIHEDDENGVVKKVLCLTACSRHGLVLENFLKMCGDLETKEVLPFVYWSSARRALKPYLRISGDKEEMITFSHQAVLEAVRKHLIPDNLELTKWHTMLATFYELGCTDARAKCYHLPYHLDAAMLKEKMVAFMREDPDSYFYITPFFRSNYLRKIRCTMMVNENTPSSAPIMLCRMCSSATRGWNPGQNWTNKDCCVVCGGLVNMGSASSPARSCQRHTRLMGPNNTQCVLCGTLVDIKLKTGPLVPTPGQICTSCNFGLTTCAKFDL